MIVKIRVTDWQPQLWHVLKLNFPFLFFILSSPFLLSPQSKGLVNTSRMWKKKHTQVGINSVCVWKKSHSVSHVLLSVCVCVYVCEVTGNSMGMCQPQSRDCGV